MRLPALAVLELFERHCAQRGPLISDAPTNGAPLRLKS
jgi:hypothetical protein